MTATLPQRGPTIPGGPRVRVDARPGVVYGYNVRDHTTGVVHPNDYIGQTRGLARRDRQHRGLAPQRDGTVREQPWSDLIDSGPHVLEAGVWTDVELDARELAWMAGRLPRLNCRDNETSPQRIPIYVQRQQRAQRDRARGLTTRWTNPDLFTTPVLPHPAPSRTVLRRAVTSRPVRWLGRHVAPWVAVWAALWLAGVVWAGWPTRDAAGVACVGLAAAVGGWRKLARPRRRRGRRPNRRRTR
jgi:hypothetical protein